MAKIQLSESTFTLIPEGTHTFKVMEVDDSKYEHFGKLAVKLQTAKGEKHTEQFSLLKENGEINDGALKAWSYFARTCLNNFSVDEIDSQDIVGCYIQATVKHEEFTYTKGEKKGQTGKNARIGDYNTSCGFSNAAKQDEEPVDDAEDLDDFLND